MPQTHWVVDGMNVIGSRPDGWWRDRPAAMRALVERLAAFARATGEPVTVFFDGRPTDTGDPGTVAVRFASRRGRNAADDEIAAFVAEAGEPGAVRVVTSDGELAQRVRSSGAEVAGAGEFRRRLDAGA
jgi:predicted RNA-binding protein with PIN domain